MSKPMCIAGWFCAAVLFAAVPEVLKLEGDVEGVHDPVIIKQKDTYYVFCTGGGRGGGGIIPIRTSKDLIHWTNAGTALPGVPEWGKKEIPGARGAWAPDISFYNGKYHLYYALSTFGSRNSAIGLATNVTLDPADPQVHVGRRRHGAALLPGQGRLERHRRQPGGRKRELASG